jgi:hypothetical protein
VDHSERQGYGAIGKNYIEAFFARGRHGQLPLLSGGCSIHVGVAPRSEAR